MNYKFYHVEAKVANVLHLVHVKSKNKCSLCGFCVDGCMHSNVKDFWTRALLMYECAGIIKSARGVTAMLF